MSRLQTILPVYILCARAQSRELAVLHAAAIGGAPFLNTSPDFNREYTAWNEQKKTRLIESILLNRAINPIWTLINEDDGGTEEVLDGQHRLRTAMEFFMNNITLRSKYFLNKDSADKWGKKIYKTLTKADQEKFRTYIFRVNAEGPELRRDMNKVYELYYLLNASPVAVNDYEQMKPLYYYYYEILAARKEQFLSLNFFRMKNSRGKVECAIIDTLMLSEDILRRSWSSIPSYRKKWLKDTLGDRTEIINAYVEANKTVIDEKLNLLIKVIRALQGGGAFEEDKQLFKSRYVIYKFALSRILAKCKTIARFNRHCKDIIRKCKESIFVDNIQEQLGCPNKNATFQRKLLVKIDKILDEEFDINNPENRRLFTKGQKKKKLQEQNNVCPFCQLKIQSGEKSHADHIIKWTAKGKTVLSNCQVLHKRCHELKE